MSLPDYLNPRSNKQIVLINHIGCIDRGWVGYIPMVDRWAALSVSFLRKSATFIVDDLWNLKMVRVTQNDES